MTHTVMDELIKEISYEIKKEHNKGKCLIFYNPGDNLDDMMNNQQMMTLLVD